jgi:hypothetical protein
MTSQPYPDAVQKFNDIAAAFDELAADVPIAEAASRSKSEPVGSDSWMMADRSEWRPSRILTRRQIITQFGELVSQAGTLLLECCRSGLLHDDDALDVFAAHELGSWGGLCVNPANAFSCLAGGPEFTEADSLEAPAVSKPAHAPISAAGSDTQQAVEGQPNTGSARRRKTAAQSV